MTSRRSVLATLGAALVCTISTVAIGHAFSNYKTRFTFTRGVELPGNITLQPGKYTFRLADSSVSRHIVEVLNEHETKKFATILAVDPLEEAVVMFGETPPELPQPIRLWYHSSRRVGPAGYEFVYPKDQATRIARTTNQRVLMTDTPLISVEAMKRAQVYLLGPSDTTAEPRGKAPAHEPPTGPTASAREIKIAQQRSSVGPREPSEGASSLPFVGLSGLMLFGAVLIALRHHSVKTVAHTHPFPYESVGWRGRAPPTISDPSLR